MARYDYADSKSKIEDIMRGRKPMPKPVLPQATFGERAGTAAGKFVKSPVGRFVAKAALPLALAQSASSDVAPESKLFPRFGEVARINEKRAQKAYEEGGVLPALKEVGSAVFPAVGGLIRDTADYAGDLFGDEATTPEIVPETAAQLPVAQPAQAPPSSAPQNYLVSTSMGGRAPAQATLPAREPKYFEINGKQIRAKESAPTLPQRPQASEYIDTQSPVYKSPMTEAVGNLNLPRFDASQDSYGDILGKRLQMLNQGASLLPARAQTKEMAEQQRRGEVDRGFGLEALEFDRDSAIKEAELTRGSQRMGETRRRTDLDRLVKLRGQDLRAESRQGTEPPSYKEQVENQEYLRTLTADLFTDAPEGFASIVPNLVQQSGQSPEQVLDVYHRITAIQEKNYPGEKLGVTELRDEMMKQLGISR